MARSAFNYQNDKFTRLLDPVFLRMQMRFIIKPFMLKYRFVNPVYFEHDDGEFDYETDPIIILEKLRRNACYIRNTHAVHVKLENATAPCNAERALVEQIWIDVPEKYSSLKNPRPLLYQEDLIRAAMAAIKKYETGDPE